MLGTGVADLRDDLADVEQQPADLMHGGSQCALTVAQVKGGAAGSAAQSNSQQALLWHLHHLLCCSGHATLSDAMEIDLCSERKDATSARWIKMLSRDARHTGLFMVL